MTTHKCRVLLVDDNERVRESKALNYCDEPDTLWQVLSPTGQDVALMKSRSLRLNWWLEAHRPQVLVLSAHRNSVANGDSHLLAVTAGPLCEVVVSVSEGFVHDLHPHVQIIARF
jgi:hypothetical protein